MGNVSKYTAALYNLLPRGFAWPREKDTEMSKLLCAFSEEYTRVDARVIDLLDESYPLTSTEMLEDWERVTGLPDTCTEENFTLQKRRQAVDQKLSSTGGQSRQFYIDAAARLGFEITIEEPKPFRVGTDTAGSPVNGEDWAHAWVVNALNDTVNFFRAGEGAAGEGLANWGNVLLECTLNKIAPAHSVLIFSYYGVFLWDDGEPLLWDNGEEVLF